MRDDSKYRPPIGECDEPLVAVTSVRLGKVRGTRYRIARRDEGALSVVVLDDERVLIDRTEGWRRLTLPGQELREIATIVATWRSARLRWAAYAGGQNMKWWGIQPVWYWAPGEQTPMRIEEGDPRLDRMRCGSVSVRLETVNAVTLGDRAVSQVLISNLEEQVGAIVLVPRGGCAIMLRNAIVVSGREPLHQDAIRKLANADPLWQLSHVAHELVYPGGGIVLDPSDGAVLEAAAKPTKE